eukprot:1419252-Heterocapsa_arctica.AAC.1
MALALLSHGVMTSASQSVAAGHPGASPQEGLFSSPTSPSKPILLGWPYARSIGPDMASGIPASWASMGRMSRGSLS